jgi:hypothetical protein
MITMITCWICDAPGPSADFVVTAGVCVAVTASGDAPEEIHAHS